MGFTYNVKLPGFNKEVWAKEICSKDYRDLIKSLYNNDFSSYVIHSNNVIEHIVPGILHEGLNVLDKLILLVNARAVSVSPDLKVKAVCKQTNKEFDYTLQLDTVFDKLSNITYKNTTNFKNITVEYSIIKAQDEIYFLEEDLELLYVYQLASSVDTVTVDDKVLNFRELNFKERCDIVEKFPIQLNNIILKALYETELKVSQNKLLFIESPYSKTPAVDLPLSTDINIILQFGKLLFTDDLNNIYRLIYNLVSKLHFQGDYLDKLAPAELYLYWSLYLQENQKASETTQNNMPSYGGSTFNPDA